jgi:hypothetical protein
MINEALCCPSKTITSDGGVNLEPVVCSFTTVPPAGAVTIRSIAHINVPAALASGEQVRADIELDARSVRPAEDPTPLSDAVTTTVRSGSTTAAAVAVKLALDDDGETTRNPGTPTTGLLLVRVTVPPCVCGSVTVQVLAEPAIKTDGAQETD